MKNGKLVLIIGGAALGGLLVGSLLSGGERVARPEREKTGKAAAAGSRPSQTRNIPKSVRLQKNLKKKQPKRKASARPSPGKRKHVPIHSNDASIGPSSARVTIVQFTDFQCPYCARAAKTMAQVHKAYGDNARIVFKHHPLSFHRDAPLAHQAAAEAHAQGRFWEYHDRLFANNRSLKRPDLEAHAKTVGLDMARFKQALDGQIHSAQIDRDKALAKQLGATGTPAFFINGRFVSGARPFKHFKKIIDEEMGR